MRMRWMGITGVALLLIALVLNLLGPRFLPTAFWGDARFDMLGSGMMGNEMLGRGMMGPGMMGHEVPDDSTQPFDLRFLNQMIVHHQSAVMSAQMMIANSQRPELRDLAQRIITAQQHEIDQMRQWRQEWYGVANVDTMQEAMMEQMQHGGMMNREQMRQMMGANVDLDRMFLQMMIPHHQEAIAMAQQALEQAEHPEIKQLAQRIITTQRAEIEAMQDYLHDRYSANRQ